ncbi:hypothetical protein [Desulfobacter sp.]|uniref:hypothetical protein n=1 Tax=Desulfobacter sp. TaxID=2294 RepID=UPI003D101433
MSIGAHAPSEALGNVDDAFGVIHLFNAVSVKVAGISTVFGNSDVDTAPPTDAGPFSHGLFLLA